MALVLNASSVFQKPRVFGNYFEFKPGQMKNMQDRIAHFLATERKDMGFVTLSEEFMDPQFSSTDKGRQALAKAKAAGVENRVTKLKSLVYNETVSLQQDLDHMNLKVDSRQYMSDSMVKFMEELSEYRRSSEDVSEERVKRIKELEDKIK